MTTLSTHVLDTERGAPASGVAIVVYAGDRQLARSETNSEGRVPDLVGRSLDPGAYRLVFEVGAYFAALGRTDPFLREVAIEFRVTADQPHYHIPLLLAPYACTTYRGS